MGTTIAEIKGHVQIPTQYDFAPEWADQELVIRRISGGDKGRMLSLHLKGNSRYSHIQLTEEQVSKLAIVLTNAFDKEIYPSE